MQNEPHQKNDTHVQYDGEDRARLPLREAPQKYNRFETVYGIFAILAGAVAATIATIVLLLEIALTSVRWIKLLVKWISMFMKWIS